jgi:hypothetical protein
MLNKSKSYWVPADINERYVAIVPYKINWSEACVWLIEHVGLPGQQYYIHHGATEMTVRFKKEQDYIWFVLRWA